jgi:hypothetical protein
VLRVLLWPLAAFFSTEMAAGMAASERDRLIEARHHARRERVQRERQGKASRKAAERSEKQARAAARQRHKADRAAEWRRAKLAKKWKRRIGLGQ